MQAIGRAVWGIDASVLYAAMNPIREAGLVEVQLGPQAGFTSFEARRPPARRR